MTRDISNPGDLNSKHAKQNKAFVRLHPSNQVLLYTTEEANLPFSFTLAYFYVGLNCLRVFLSKFSSRTEAQEDDSAGADEMPQKCSGKSCPSRPVSPPWGPHTAQPSTA